MADLQKTIKGLRCHSEPKFGPDEYFCETCPYDEATCGLDVPNDALSLLKAQEPRVMTLDEIKAWACKTGSQKDAVYIQNFNDPEFVWAYLGKFESDSGISNFDGYGYSWCCWTSRPTNEQRKEVKWDG